MATLIVPAEIASDNYVNSYSFYNQFMDRLVLDYTDRDIEQMQIEYGIARDDSAGTPVSFTATPTAATPR